MRSRPGDVVALGGADQRSVRTLAAIPVIDCRRYCSCCVDKRVITLRPRFSSKWCLSVLGVLGPRKGAASAATSVLSTATIIQLDTKSMGRDSIRPWMKASGIVSFCRRVSLLAAIVLQDHVESEGMLLRMSVCPAAESTPALYTPDPVLTSIPMQCNAVQCKCPTAECEPCPSITLPGLAWSYYTGY